MSQEQRRDSRSGVTERSHSVGAAGARRRPVPTGRRDIARCPLVVAELAAPEELPQVACARRPPHFTATDKLKESRLPTQEGDSLSEVSRHVRSYARENFQIERGEFRTEKFIGYIFCTFEIMLHT